MWGAQQQWKCDACTFLQSSNNIRCELCSNANPFKIGSASSNIPAAYYQAAPPKPKPIVKEKYRYQSKPRANGEFGKIIYQKNRITKQQVLDTYAIYLLNRDIKTSSWPLYVFGENDIDKNRISGQERDMIGGLAGVLGDYDSNVSFGVTTTFYKNKYVNHDFNAFKKIIDDDFVILLKYIINGHDIIVPSPNMQDLYGDYEKSYWKTVNNIKTQVIFHNIGTGLAMIPFNYIEYIQTKFDNLKKIGDSNTIDINNNNNNNSNNDDKKVDKNKSDNVDNNNNDQNDQNNDNTSNDNANNNNNTVNNDNNAMNAASNTDQVPMDIVNDQDKDKDNNK